MGRTGNVVADATPIVVDLERGADLLGVDPRELEPLVADLEVWGPDAWGRPVWRWADVVAAAAAAGVPIPAGRRHAWRASPAIRRTPYGQEQWQT